MCSAIIENPLTTTLIITLQYTVIVYLLFKKPELLSADGSLGIFIWIPLIGPMAMIGAFSIVTMFVAPFLIPLALANGTIFILNKFLSFNKRIDYII